MRVRRKLLSWRRRTRLLATRSTSISISGSSPRSRPRLAHRGDHRADRDPELQHRPRDGPDARGVQARPAGLRPPRQAPPDRIALPRLGSKLAADLRLSSGAMTNRLDRLEAAGLIRRLPDPHDRRRTIVRPTELGNKMWDKTVGAAALREIGYGGAQPGRRSSSTCSSWKCWPRPEKHREKHAGRSRRLILGTGPRRRYPRRAKRRETVADVRSLTS